MVCETYCMYRDSCNLIFFLQKQRLKDSEHSPCGVLENSSKWKALGGAMGNYSRNSYFIKLKKSDQNIQDVCRLRRKKSGFLRFAPHRITLCELRELVENQAYNVDLSC